ncbi:MAG TPA: sigma-70 family RNA polymerase sigma factor [Myxococcaceae bacterium]|nr:sigma-70 family RNA polymerase sigma factor [Myxococcaceae bacterium]
MAESTTLDSTQLETHRAALTGHCYRMLGSPEEADDAVQETFVRAWRNLDRFEQRSSLKTWLYSIATRVCLDALADRARRVRPMELGPVGTVSDELCTRPAAEFIEPVPESEVLPDDASPAELAILRQSIRLAFMAALQHLPPRQRAALLLMEVLGCSAAEVAATLDMSVPAVNSAIQRARATLEERQLHADAVAAEAEDPELVHRYVEAFERYDMDALTRLLHQDVVMSMPPYAIWLRGPQAVSDWMLGRGIGCRGSRMLATAANGAPAFGQYRNSGSGKGFHAWGLVVLELADGKVTGINTFLDTERLFPRFGLPLSLPA